MGKSWVMLVENLLSWRENWLGKEKLAAQSDYAMGGHKYAMGGINMEASSGANQNFDLRGLHSCWCKPLNIEKLHVLQQCALLLVKILLCQPLPFSTSNFSFNHCVCQRWRGGSSLESNEPLYCHTFLHTSTAIHITYFNQHVVIIQNSMVMSTHL